MGRKKKQEGRLGVPTEGVRLVCYRAQVSGDGYDMVFGFANDILSDGFSGVSAPMLIYEPSGTSILHGAHYTAASYQRFCKSFCRAGDFPVLIGNLGVCDYGYRVLSHGLYKPKTGFDAAKHLAHTEAIKEKRRNRTPAEVFAQRTCRQTRN